MWQMELVDESREKFQHTRKYLAESGWKEGGKSGHHEAKVQMWFDAVDGREKKKRGARQNEKLI